MTSPFLEDLPPTYKIIFNFSITISVDELLRLNERFSLGKERFDKSEDSLRVAVLKLGFMECIASGNYHTAGDNKKCCTFPSSSYPSEADIKIFKKWVESEECIKIINYCVEGTMDKRYGRVIFDGKITVIFEIVQKKSGWGCVVM